VKYAEVGSGAGSRHEVTYRVVPVQPLDNIAGLKKKRTRSGLGCEGLFGGVTVSSAGRLNAGGTRRRGIK